MSQNPFIKREMRPRKGRFGAIPHVGNKLFPSFSVNKIFLKKFEKKILFFEKNSIIGKIFSIFEKKINNLMMWQFPRHINSLRGMEIFHWNKVPKFGSSKITHRLPLASFLF